MSIIALAPAAASAGRRRAGPAARAGARAGLRRQPAAIAVPKLGPVEQEQPRRGPAERPVTDQRVCRARAGTGDQVLGALGVPTAVTATNRTGEATMSPPGDRHPSFGRSRHRGRRRSRSTSSSRGHPAGPAARTPRPARHPSPRDPRARPRAPCAPIASRREGLRRKWTPSTIASTEVAVAPPGAVTAASSPLPTSTALAGRGARCREPLAEQVDQLELAAHRAELTSGRYGATPPPPPGRSPPPPPGSRRPASGAAPGRRRARRDRGVAVGSALASVSIAGRGRLSSVSVVVVVAFGLDRVRAVARRTGSPGPCGSGKSSQGSAAAADM